MTNEEPKYVKTYVVLDDGETYAELEGCTLVMVTEKGQKLMEDMDGIKGLADYENADGSLYGWRNLEELLCDYHALVLAAANHEHKEAA